MAEAQVAQANHQTHGVNPTWTKHLQAAGDGVVAVQLLALLRHIREARKQTNGHEQRNHEVQDATHCCPDVVPVAPLALNETA
jgi:hypothetical protein